MKVEGYYYGKGKSVEDDEKKNKKKKKSVDEGYNDGN